MGIPFAAIEQLQTAEDNDANPYLISPNSPTQIRGCRLVTSADGTEIPVFVEAGAIVVGPLSLNWSLNIAAPLPDSRFDYETHSWVPYPHDDLISFAHVIYHQSTIVTPFSPSNFAVKRTGTVWGGQLPYVADFSPDTLIMSPGCSPTTIIFDKSAGGVEEVTRSYPFGWDQRTDA
jgi:hypothetical protein